MAGDWLKMEVSTPEKAEVLAITARMGWDDPDLTVGKLFRLWRWFDQQTVDGNARSVTPALLDRIVGVSGFCAALQEVGWLVVDETGVSLPKFDRHNGATAKSRALTAKRVANHKTNASGNGGANARSVSRALPREEKRREEKNKEQKQNIRTPEGAKPKAGKETVSAADLVAMGVPEQLAKDWLTVRKSKHLPLTPTALDGVRTRAAAEGMDLPQAVKYLAEKGWAGFYADKSPPGRRRPATEDFGQTDYGQGGLL